MNNPMDNHNNVSAALRVSTLFLPFIFLFSDFQNRFHIRKHYSRLVFFPLHFWAWNGHTTTEMKILVGSSAPQYHQSFIDNKLSISLRGMHRWGPRRRRRRRIDWNATIWERGEKRGSELLADDAFQCVITSTRKKRRTTQSIACMRISRRPWYVFNAVVVFYILLCVGLKTRSTETLRRRRCAGWWAGFFFVFQIEWHNEKTAI